MLNNVLSIIASYMLGSISSAVIVCKILKLPDPRSQGSGNPGATNVLRTGNKKAAAITLIGDSLKGLLPMLIAQIYQAEPTLLAGIGLGAFLGHLYPIWFNFRGGKGVATALGVQIGLDWMFGGIIAISWLIIAKLTRISSLAALISMSLAPIALWLLHPKLELLFMQIIISILLLWRHHDNMARLISGAEATIKAPDTEN
ncbi:acyl-phosphate glycerol 3-phosphate acyltransferase [Achromatium sp. WMS2]|nr:acyl-phosphate glycerol 3-phosphate acyltransferase [Achromatium sp. WMS2]